MILSLLLNRWVLGAIGALALMAGGYFAWAHYVESYRQEGRAQARAELLPLLVSATGQLDRDVDAFSKVAASFQVINENSVRLKKLAAKAQEVKIVRQTVEKTRIEYIDRIVPAGATECERVFDVIDKGAER